MEEFNEKLIICGKSGSGKDYLLIKLRAMGFKTSIKTTTRPQRTSETNGIDYHFVTNKAFKDSEMVVEQTFNNHQNDEWFYGFERKEFNEKNVFIMTPGEVSQLDENIRKECFVVYLNIDLETRKNRLSDREDINDSIQRRLDADEKDFSSFEDFDLSISDPQFEVEDIISLMF